MIRNGRLLAKLLLPEVDRQVEKLRRQRAENGFAGAVDGVGFFDESPDDDGCLCIDDAVFELLNRRNSPRWQLYADTIDDARQTWDQHPLDEAHDSIWAYYKGRVDLASLELFARQPDQYLLFRDLGFQDEMFDGLSLLVEDFPYLRLPFRRISQVAKANYLAFNEAMQRLARELWPDAADRPARLMALLYRVLPELVRHRDEAFRAWVGVTAQQHNIDDLLDPEQRTNTWSGVRRVQPGDLYFAYCASPVRALRAVFTVSERPESDPFGGWHGHWVEINRIAMFTLPFRDMKADPVLGKWSAIRRQFQGITLEQIPPAAYARIRELLVGRGVDDDLLLPEADVSGFLCADDFESEEDFEIKRIKPLLKELGFGRSQYQAECVFQAGSQRHHCRVDFLVKTAQGRVISLFEDKKSTKGYRRRDDAYQQGRSYALQLNTPSFVVASAESLLVYGRARSKTDFVGVEQPSARYAWPELANPRTKESLRRLLLSHAGLAP